MVAQVAAWGNAGPRPHAYRSKVIHFNVDSKRLL
jgi:hypothetical protein